MEGGAARTEEVAHVSVRTTADGFEQWKVLLDVPKATTIAALKELLAGPPHGLKLEPSQRILKRLIKSNMLGATKDTDRVSSDIVLLDFHPEARDGGKEPDAPPAEPGPAPAPPAPKAEEMEVTLLTTSEQHPDWKISLKVAANTTIVALKRLVEGPPHNLRLKPGQKICQKMKRQGILSGMKDTDPVHRELLLLNFDPYEDPDEAAAKSPPPPAVPPKKAAEDAQAKAALFKLAREEAQRAKEYFDSFKQIHAKQSPEDRAARSWSRSVAFAENVLNFTGQKIRRGTPENPQVIWLLNCTEAVEVALMQRNCFSDTNWQGLFAMDVILWGEDVLDRPPKPLEHCMQPRVRSANYSSIDTLGKTLRPDYVVICMPNMGRERTGSSACSPATVIPEPILVAAEGVPVVLTLRSQIPGRSLATLGGRGKSSPILFTPVRNPFSAQAGRADCEYDDNGWLLGVQDTKILRSVLDLDMVPNPPEENRGKEEDIDREKRIPAIFWGIIDLKYDPAAPVTERVKMLETGDGRTSRFSGAGSDILKRYRGKYRLEGLDAGAGKHAVVSANKKLTHDLMESRGYRHLLPKQVCFPRVYAPDLARRIVEGLELTEKDLVVLKLCNRTRAAGVLPVPLDELDEVLEELLQPPKDLERWVFRNRAKAGTAVIDLGYGCWEEQVRHWWSNECPFFVAERFAASMPITWEGKQYDATMRVAFVLHRKNAAKGNSHPGPASAGQHEMPPAEELEIDWIGGYWKLPKVDLSSPKLRDRIISAARTSGTAYVDFHVLAEVYAAMGNSIQLLFGGSEPTAATLAETYKSEPTTAAYLVARLAVAMRQISSSRRIMNTAKALVDQAEDGPSKACAQSFVSRGFGVLDAMTPPGRWEDAQVHLMISLESLPTNASTLYLLGMARLEMDEIQQAVELMSAAMLLDLDFKAPYVNLGVAYLRLRQFDAAIEVSEAGLTRHPETPQCRYHLGVACYQKSLLLEDGNPYPKSGVKETYEDLRRRGLKELLESRDSDEAQRMLNRYRCEVPWLDEDDRMVEALRPHKAALGRSREVGQRQLHKPVDITNACGWKFFGWRT